MTIKPKKPSRPTPKPESAEKRDEVRETKTGFLNRNESRQTKRIATNRDESRQTKGLWQNRNWSLQRR